MRRRCRRGETTGTRLPGERTGLCVPLLLYRVEEQFDVHPGLRFPDTWAVSSHLY